MISRRSFNQAVIGIAAALVLPFKGITSQAAPTVEMEAIGGEIAFNYPPSIYHTLCRYVEYHSPSRSLLLVDEIPHGYMPRKKMTRKSYGWMRFMVK